MKIIGIVVEYNPFHNGHLYQINKVKEMYKDSIIIVAMSSHFMQRGDISILNKWEKTSVALQCGVDIVVEIPTPFSIQSGDIFASGSIKLLSELKIDTLVFGSESNDLNKLIEISKLQINNKKFNKLFKEHISNGLNYPTALSKTILNLTNYNVNTSNDLLAISYIKEILKSKYKIDILPIKRTNDYNDINNNDSIVSANNIREKIKNNINIKPFVPKETYEYVYNKKINEDTLLSLLKYKILSSETKLNDFHLVTEGIEKRIYKSALVSKNLDDLINNIKTKRFTYNRINRTLINILLNYTKKDNKKYAKINYIRILGMTKKGQKYINKIKKELTLPIISKFNNKNDYLKFELFSTSIYALILNETKLIKDEYTNHIIIK